MLNPQIKFYLLPSTPSNTTIRQYNVRGMALRGAKEGQQPRTHVRATAIDIQIYRIVQKYRFSLDNDRRTQSMACGYSVPAHLVPLVVQPLRVAPVTVALATILGWLEASSHGQQVEMLLALHHLMAWRRRERNPDRLPQWLVAACGHLLQHALQPSPAFSQLLTPCPAPPLHSDCDYAVVQNSTVLDNSHRRHTGAVLHVDAARY
jgi:hypothetical protein